MPPRKVNKGPSSSTTSMQALYFKHYQESVAKLGPKTVVLLQVGVFFEMYDVLTIETGAWVANVQQIAELCGSSVQPKPSVADPGKQTFFWGFPEGALEKFEPILVGAGYSVVVITQTKDTTGDVVARAIDHVASPGIYVPSSGSISSVGKREEQILLGVYVEPYTDSRRGAAHWYLASTAFDVTTGKTVSMETDLTLIDGKPVLDVVTPFWSVYPPAEVCFYWCGPQTQVPSSTQVATLFTGAAIGRTPNVHIYTLDIKKESVAPAERIRSAFLAETFRHDSALTIEEHLDVSYYHFARRCLYHLLVFVKDHNPSYLTLLHDHSIWTPDDTVLLGNAALEQLGMLPQSTDRESESLLWWLQRALTAMGRRALRERLLIPIADVAELSSRQDRIAALRDDKSVRDAIEKTLRGSYDLARVHRRFQLGAATSEDLVQLYTTYERALTLLHTTKGGLLEAPNNDVLQTHLEGVLRRFSLDRLRATQAQGQSSTDKPAIGSTHPWARGIHATQDSYEDQWKALEIQVSSLRDKMEVELKEVDTIKWELKDDAPFTLSTTGRRGAILSTPAVRGRLKEEVTTVKKGSSGQVQLISPLLNRLNTEAITLRSEWRSKAAEIWTTEWRTWIQTGIDNGTLHDLVDWISNLDAECTLARLSDAYGYVRPVYAQEGVGFAVTGLRHPIIERVHTSVPYISHNLAYGSFSSGASEDVAATESGILLYGVNAAGKSSLGKAIGLAVLMAQIGMPVSATTMTLVPYKGIFTRILGNDNLWAGMSSFVVEMTEFRSILRSAISPGFLVIGDELCAGTETASATSIVAAGVKTLADKGAHFFFATHLHELAEIPEIADHAAVKAYHLTVRPSPTQHGVLIYDRKLKAGTGSPIYGLEVCRGLDMDPAFLTTAFNFRKRLLSDEGKARVSRYNTAVVVDSCAICGGKDQLETHHIVPQAVAVCGMIAPGVSKHVAGNLVALCGACHTKHHKGLLEIQGWVETSKGRQLLWN